MKMITINYGKVNDCKVYAIFVNDGLVPLTKIDLEFASADICITYDSGSYPSITDIDQYICDQVIANKLYPIKTVKLIDSNMAKTPKDAQDELYDFENGCWKL